MKNNFITKYLIIIALLAVIVGSVTFPHKTKATGVPVLDAAHIATTVSSWAKENSGKIARDVIAKRIIDYLVQETITWIQGGGKPQFVSDWKGFLKKAGDIAFDSVFREVGMAGICAPFKSSLRISLLPVKKFPVRVECTLDKVVANINNFYADFKQGGFRALASAYQPQNNFYGQLVITNDEIQARISSEQDTSARDAAAGSGFLSVQKCAGGQNQDQYCNKQCLTGQGSKSDFDQCFSNCMATKLNTRQLCDYSGGKMETQTPGDTVGKSVAAAVTSDSQWAANIESWVSAIVNAAINRVATEGLAKMTGEGGGTYYPPEYESLRSTERDQQNQKYKNEINKYVAGWTAQQNSKQESLDAAKESIITINSITGINAKLKLAQCPFASSVILTDEQINALKDNIPRYNANVDALTAQVATLQKKLDTANRVKTFIDNSSVLPEGAVKADQVSNAFINTYGGEIPMDDAITAASNETNSYQAGLATQKSTLNKMQTTLDKCTASVSTSSG